MKRKKSRTKFLLFMLLCLPLTACGGGTQQNVRRQAALGSEADQAELTAVAVVKAIDQNNQNMTLQDVATGEEQTFSYNGATQVYSKNDVALVMNQLLYGEIVDISYDSDQTLNKIQISKDAWEYQSVKGEDIDRTEQTISVTGRTYAYDSQISVFQGEQQLMLLDLNDCDEVSIKGIGSKVYSLIVTQGHGFVRLGGQDAFLGGTLEVDRDIFQNVGDNMLLTVGAGEHTIVLKNGILEAVETVTVAENEEVFLDLSQYEQPEVTEGKVKFIVTPSDASLIINGKSYQANRAISLPFGNYNVAVRAEGYQAYTGVLRVQPNKTACQKIYVELVEDSQSKEATEAPTATGATPTAGVTETAGVLNDNTPSPTEVAERADATTTAPSATSLADSQRTISVKGPEGASVYVDGVYQGIAPVIFTKKTGEITISLSKEGYVTRSYTVDIADKDEDVEYSFAELEKK